MNDFSENLKIVMERIHAAAQKYGRSVDSIRLMAASKTFSADDIKIAASAGLQEFGENYAQEAIQKIKTLADPKLIWHYIGPIQSNKTRLISENFNWVHSIDRIKTARRLNDARPDSSPPLNACIQINISGEKSKSGIAPQQLLDLARQISTLPNIRLRGLMAIPAVSKDTDEQRQSFKLVNQYFQSLNKENFKLDTLSMGTSNDLEAAIAEGSTMIRLGTAIFGPRHA